MEKVKTIVGLGFKEAFVGKDKNIIEALNSGAIEILKEESDSTAAKLKKFLEEERDSLMSKVEELYCCFWQEFYIDYELALKLNRLDVIENSLLKVKTEKGAILKYILEYTEHNFILKKKKWFSQGIELYFEAVHYENENDLINILK